MEATMINEDEIIFTKDPEVTKPEPQTYNIDFLLKQLEDIQAQKESQVAAILEAREKEQADIRLILSHCK